MPNRMRAASRPGGQFVTMLGCQLGHAKLAARLCDGLWSRVGKLTHLGLTALSRSTLACANGHRPW
jgi:hypothetical protein